MVMLMRFRGVVIVGGFVAVVGFGETHGIEAGRSNGDFDFDAGGNVSWNDEIDVGGSGVRCLHGSRRH